MSSSNLSSVVHKAPINITIPKGATIFFTVPGEEGRADLTPYSSLLLSRHATLDASDIPDFDFDTAVDFGALSVDENVIFMRNSENRSELRPTCPTSYNYSINGFSLIRRERSWSNLSRTPAILKTKTLV